LSEPNILALDFIKEKEERALKENLKKEKTFIIPDKILANDIECGKRFE